MSLLLFFPSSPPANDNSLKKILKLGQVFLNGILNKSLGLKKLLLSSSLPPQKKERPLKE
jgi:hypothetical protein